MFSIVPKMIVFSIWVRVVRRQQSSPCGNNHYEVAIKFNIYQNKFKLQGQGQNYGLVTRNTHMQYESPIFSALNVMINVIFLSRSNSKVKVTR